jgi:hypothetical protein
MMLNRSRSFWTRIFIAFSLSLILACDTQLAPILATPTIQITETVPPSASPVPPTATSMPSATPVPPTATPIPPTETLIPSATASPTIPSTVAPVVVKAVRGNLNIRRGPGPEYNPVGALLGGQSSTATARNDDASWLYIGIPFISNQFGWVSTKTQYSSITGDVMFLPVMAVPPADPAYIRNCTFHDMLVKPAGVILLSQANPPANRQQFFPGEYSIFDQVTLSKVWGFVLVEGKTVDIKKDGLGKSYSCP